MHRLVRAVAVAVVAASAVLIAGPAVAAPAPSHWQLAVVDELDPPVAGDTVDLYADLRSDSGPIAGKSATLLIRTVGSGVPFKAVATVVTDANGTASAQVRLVRSTAFRWQFAGDSEYTASSTGTLIRTMASKVAAKATDTTPARGQVLVVLGRAYPNMAGNKVRLWMGEIPRPLTEQPAPVFLAAGRVHADGTFRLARSFTGKGWKRLFVEVDGDSTNGTGFSNYVVVKVG